eukprot:1875278-Amphidinium_carterae.2
MCCFLRARSTVRSASFANLGRDRQAPFMTLCSHTVAPKVMGHESVQLRSPVSDSVLRNCVAESAAKDQEQRILTYSPCRRPVVEDVVDVLGCHCSLEVIYQAFVLHEAPKVPEALELLDGLGSNLGGALSALIPGLEGSDISSCKARRSEELRGLVNHGFLSTRVGDNVGKEASKGISPFRALHGVASSLAYTPTLASSCLGHTCTNTACNSSVAELEDKEVGGLPGNG